LTRGRKKMSKASKEETIRNPSQKELDALADGGIKKVQAIPVSELDLEKVDEDTLKPIDNYEPNPVAFKLPSGKTTVRRKYLTDKNEVFIRRMGTSEEAMFKNFMNKDFLSAIEPQLDACLKTNIKVEELSFIDKIPMYIFLLAITYGKDFTVKCECQMCRKEYDVDIDLEKDAIKKFKYIPDGFEYPKKIQLESYGGDIVAHTYFQTIGENNLISDKGTIYDQMLTLMKRIEGTDKNDNKVKEDDRENIIKFLSEADRKKFREWIAEFGEYGTDLMIKKKVCKNESCEFKNKEVELMLPVIDILMKLIDRIN